MRKENTCKRNRVKNADREMISDILHVVNDVASPNHYGKWKRWELTLTDRQTAGSATPPLLLSGSGFSRFWPC